MIGRICRQRTVLRKSRHQRWCEIIWGLIKSPLLIGYFEQVKPFIWKNVLGSQLEGSFQVEFSNTNVTFEHLSEIQLRSFYYKKPQLKLSRVIRKVWAPIFNRLRDNHQFIPDAPYMGHITACEWRTRAFSQGLPFGRIFSSKLHYWLIIVSTVLYHVILKLLGSSVWTEIRCICRS